MHPRLTRNPSNKCLKQSDNETAESVSTDASTIHHLTVYLPDKEYG